MLPLKKVAVSLIPLVLMAIFLIQKSFGYTFTTDFNKGFYWQNFPIQMKKFVTDPNDGTILEKLTNEAADDWEGATGKNLWNFLSVETTSSFTGNYIRWSDHFGSETGYDPNTTLAITIRYNQGTYFQQTVIILNGNISYLRQNWGSTLKTTILHEIGHTLGLDHSNVNAIMAPTLSNLTILQPDDIEGVNRLVDETIKRQTSGYISPYSNDGNEKNSTIAACGAVENIGESGGPDNRVINFLGSLLIGLIVAQMIRLKNNSRVLI